MHEEGSIEESPESNEGLWEGICLDDGTGRNVYYVNKNGKKSRIPPPNFEPEFHENGMRRYYYRGICIRCRTPSPAVFLTRSRGDYGFAFNYCSECLLSTSLGTTKLKGNGDIIWENNVDTPLQTFLDLRQLALAEDREEVILERSKEANLEVNTAAKQRRNMERVRVVKLRALQSGIAEGVFISMGFGEEYNEYFGTVDEEGRPFGLGMMVYSDNSIYIGDWYEGKRHSLKNSDASWVREDGLSYEGTWQNDLKHGFGTLRYPDGGWYKGEFAKGYEHGQGVKTYADGSKHEGRFRYGKRDGPGTFTNMEGQQDKRIFREHDVFHEKPIPKVFEVIDEVEENIKLFQPESLMVIAIRAVAKTMHTRQSLLPPAIVHDRLQEFLKPLVAEEYIRTMHPAGNKEFSDYLPSFAFFSLETVAVKHIRFVNYDSQAFLYVTGGNKALKTLELVNTRMDPSALDLLSKKIASGTLWNNMSTLDLSFNIIDTMNVRNLINSVAQGAPSLRCLKLAGCKISASGAGVIGEYLAENNTLVDLDLAFNSIQAVGAEFLSEALTKNATLTSLNLRQNNIGMVGGESLADAMKKNLTLKVLVIADNKISGEIATAIAARLKGNTKDVATSFRSKELIVPLIHQERHRRKGKHE